MRRKAISSLPLLSLMLPDLAANCRYIAGIFRGRTHVQREGAFLVALEDATDANASRHPYLAPEKLRLRWPSSHFDSAKATAFSGMIPRIQGN